MQVFFVSSRCTTFTGYQSGTAVAGMDERPGWPDAPRLARPCHLVDHRWSRRTGRARNRRRL